MGSCCCLPWRVKSGTDVTMTMNEAKVAEEVIPQESKAVTDQNTDQDNTNTTNDGINPLTNDEQSTNQDDNEKADQGDIPATDQVEKLALHHDRPTTSQVNNLPLDQGDANNQNIKPIPDQEIKPEYPKPEKNPEVKFPDHDDDDKPDQSMIITPLISVGSVPNERYAFNAPSSHDHDNEDEYLVDESSDSSSVFLCVLDGHDGRNAVEFVKKYLWDNHLAVSQSDSPKETIDKWIKDADAEFFKGIDEYIGEKLTIQESIPKEMKSYEAQMTFPTEVARLQELETRISGGCTAVIAVITKKTLYVANVGDSRAVLVYQEHDRPAFHVKQLSKDHGVEDESELKRLSDLGLDPEQMIRTGRLGTQENTRSIGDYSIKGGYRDVDLICHATDEPGIAIPHVTSKEIDPSFKYLILMTDGVNKTLEAVAGQDGGNGNDLIAEMIDKHVNKHGIENAAFSILEEIRQTQHDLYQISASENPHSDVTVANRKRDDMTLLICQFSSISKLQ